VAREYQSREIINNDLSRDDLYKATISDPNIKTIVEKNTRILKTTNKKEEDNGAYNINNLLFAG